MGMMMTKLTKNDEKLMKKDNFFKSSTRPFPFLSLPLTSPHLSLSHSLSLSLSLSLSCPLALQFQKSVESQILI